MDINATQELMQIASRVLAGEIATQHGNFQEAWKHADIELTSSRIL